MAANSLGWLGASCAELAITVAVLAVITIASWPIRPWRYRDRGSRIAPDHQARHWLEGKKG